MKHAVRLTEDAAADLADIVDYVVAADGPLRARRVLDQFETTIARLEELPERGPHPPELLALGIREYREVFFKPYRVIYRVQAPSVWVYVVADGRRDMQRLLARRLLGA
jgi:toxin ParE1/3/4